MNEIKGTNIQKIDLHEYPELYEIVKNTMDGEFNESALRRERLLKSLKHMEKQIESMEDNKAFQTKLGKMNQLIFLSNLVLTIFIILAVIFK